MNNLKRILSIGLVTGLALTISGCKAGDERNQNVPYGNIKADTNAAWVGDANNPTYKISQKELYNRLKYSYGYNVFTNELDKVIYRNELTSENLEKIYQENKVKINEKIMSEVFSASNTEALKKAEKDKEKLNTAILKYIDKMALNGITVTKENLVYEYVKPTLENNLQNETVEFTNLTKELKEYYAKSFALDKAGEKFIIENANKEKLGKEEDIKNNYYVGDKTEYADNDIIKNQYESNLKNYYTASGIVLKYNSLREAKAAVTSANNLASASDFTTLYNNYYNYDTTKQLTDFNQVGETADTIFINNYEYSELSTIASEINTYFTKELEDGEYTKEPISFGGKYYLIYREELTYEISGTDEVYDFIQLKDKVPNKLDAIYNECIELYAKNNASSVKSLIFELANEDLELKIYDPFIENSFANAYTFYEYTTESNNDLIFKTKDSEYKVADFYQDLMKNDVNSVLTNLLIDKYLLDLNADEKYVSDFADLKKDKEKKLKEELSTFKKGNASLNKAYGESNYLFYTYGYMTESEVINSQLATDIKSAYTSQFISTLWSENGTLTTDANKLSILNNILDTALLEYEENKKDFIELNIDHILISIDNNHDGNPDDMELFVASLSDTERVKFEEAVTNLTQAIIREVQAIEERESVLDILKYIVEAFNNNYETCDNKNWSDYKTYNFTLTAESLGDVDNTSITNYVENFQDYTREIYKTAIANEIKIDEDNEDQGQLIVPNIDGKKVELNDVNYSNLGLTEFGYHFISLNSYEKENDDELDFEFSDKSSYYEDYLDIELVLDDRDEDNKIKLTIPNLANSDISKPSINQMIVYYVQYTQNNISDLPTSLKNDLSELLDTTIQKYQNSTFQNFLLVHNIGKIEAAEGINYNYENYKKYLQNQAEDYDTESNYYSWYNENMIWTK